MGENTINVAEFIRQVRIRPPLSNHKLREFRKRDTVSALWEEVADHFPGMTAALCKKKWKNYKKGRANVKSEQKKVIRSGAGSDDLRKDYLHEKEMKFLDILLQDKAECIGTLSAILEEDEDQNISDAWERSIYFQSGGGTVRPAQTVPSPGTSYIEVLQPPRMRNCCEEVNAAYERLIDEPPRQPPPSSSPVLGKQQHRRAASTPIHKGGVAPRGRRSPLKTLNEIRVEQGNRNGDHGNVPHPQENLENISQHNMSGPANTSLDFNVLGLERAAGGENDTHLNGSARRQLHRADDNDENDNVNILNLSPIPHASQNAGNRGGRAPMLQNNGHNSTVRRQQHKNRIEENDNLDVSNVSGMSRASQNSAANRERRQRQQAENEARREAGRQRMRLEMEEQIRRQREADRQRRAQRMNDQRIEHDRRQNNPGVQRQNGNADWIDRAVLEELRSLKEDDCASYFGRYLATRMRRLPNANQDRLVITILEKNAEEEERVQT